MGVFNLCRKYVNELPKGQIFVTRELLTYGHRDAVDKCTQAMVGASMIRRLARGVFVRNDIGLELPKIEAIAEAKARAFSKLIIPSVCNQAAALGLEKPRKLRKKGNKFVEPKPPYNGTVFSILGTTSEFWTIHGYVKLQHISARKYFVAQQKVGEIMAGIWHASKDASVNFQSILWNANLTTVENKQLRQLAAWVPEWIHEHLRDENAAGRIHVPWRLYPHVKLSFPEPLMKDAITSRVKESASIYRIGTEYGANPPKTLSCEDTLDSQDLLGLLIACTQGEYNFNLKAGLFSSMPALAPA